ncbi:PAS domain-containing sensor histidine kinase [Lacihabitans sp. CS3-21]|uniref:sensor histidine kinase n=1 Tax=Lacihabitans sp. CS3-21 TaxID=2487332 RepID=UPI0020CB804E|nr:HAMP domain-containing sensor histidine kinase [Lacihabitans sp. CS3-21]MCP9749135.1 sensor histidine kinase [Lacihabitans sp. CS3-21]
MKNFSLGILLRSLIILGLSLGFSWSFFQKNVPVAIIFGLLQIISVANLYKYVTSLNRKMKRLFESIQYQDFAITFKADNKLGESFRDLNNDLNAVINSFNQVRAEREATLHFINAIIQQINVGILSYDTEGKIEINNQAANKLLKVYRLKHISDIEKQNPFIFECIASLKSGEPKLLSLPENDLSFSVTEIQMRGRKIRLVAIHNIRSELQIKELEAWQNLTKVLRHEIMNSVTPIVSLAETMKDIVENEIKANNPKEQESIDDLKDALQTVQRRGSGIMKFVNAYREFTSIPTPNKYYATASQLLKTLEGIFAQKALESKLKISYEVESDFETFIDIEQIEQVLINIVKNAFEVENESENKIISITAHTENGTKTIEIADNGIGIDKTLQEKIFIPFYTTKKTGSGIGLSLSRQIMQLNDGNINFYENQPSGAVFVLQFA